MSTQTDLMGNRVELARRRKEFRLYVEQYARDQCKKLTMASNLDMTDTTTALMGIGTYISGLFTPEDWTAILQATRDKDIISLANTLSKYLK